MITAAAAIANKSSHCKVHYHALTPSLATPTVCNLDTIYRVDRCHFSLGTLCSDPSPPARIAYAAAAASASAASQRPTAANHVTP